ncbi:putative ATP-dependent DNA ligase YkoU [compost metagenome]
MIDPETANFNFELMQKRSKITKKAQIHAAMKHLPVTFYCFDILRHNQRDLRGLPLIKRKSIQESVFTSNHSFSAVTYVEERGNDLYQIICDRKMEGIVAKNMNSMYLSNRSNAWQKIINWTYEDIYITGYRKNDFGWLASVPMDNGEFRPVGIIELGVKPKSRMAFYSMKDSLKLSEDQDHVYLQPLLKARVKIVNWTGNGMLRSPVFVEFIK